MSFMNDEGRWLTVSTFWWAGQPESIQALVQLGHCATRRTKPWGSELHLPGRAEGGGTPDGPAAIWETPSILGVVRFCR